MKRIEGLDFLRGIAVVGMVIYHAVFIADFYGLVALDLNAWSFVIWRRIVQFLFLGLVGVSLVLAFRSRQADFLRRQFWRVGVLALAAGLVSFGSWVVLGDLFVRFGILHLIAVSVFCLMWFVRWRWVVLVISVVALFLPFNFLAYPSVDYFPLFPWISVVGFGIVLSDLVLDMEKKAICVVNFKAPLSPYWPIRLWRSLLVSLHLIFFFHIQRWFLKFEGIAWVNFLGRKALLVYLVHVPVIGGIVWLLNLSLS